MNIIRVFDIETGPQPDEVIRELLPPPKLGRLKDPEKIRAATEEHYADALSEAALDALTGQLLAVGIKDSDGPIKIIGESGDEGDALEDFWTSIAADRNDRRLPMIVGFNSHGFDLPFVIRRSIILNVPVPTWVRNGRYFSRRFLDLREVWQCGDRYARGALSTVSKACGLRGKKGSGAQFAYLWANDRPAAIAYLKGDVLDTEALAIRMGAHHITF